MSSTRRERKVITVLFADLVGFTSRAEQLDPEDVEAILAPYHARLRSELERFGGTVEKFIGDAVMALFGAPVAHEDDPERAVRAALAIRDWARTEETVQVRIAVNTGEALINLGARPDAGEGMAAGDVVNTTARLQAAAPVNGVLVGETTYRATRATIDYRNAGAIEAKGKAEPVRVWEAGAAMARVTSEAVSISTPLVGRERELTLLRDLLVRVREESGPQLVTLVGVPGIGKSRLVHELMQVVERGGVLTYWRRGRSLPYGEGVTLWALSEIVKAQAGILENDSADEVARKLRQAVENVIPDPRDAAWVETHLGPLARIGGSDDAGGDRRSEGFAAWRRFFEGMAEQRPLVLVFEDLHWADDELLDFVDHLVEWASGVPILVVSTARPELFERRSNWGGGKLNATTLSLSPLSDQETGQLLASVLDRPLLPAEVQQRLLARAGGNPLYAEQYAQMLLEGSNDDELPIPESVQGIIAARLDRLPANEKGLLQDAAVLGKVFWLGGLAEGRERGDAEQQLHALERKGFVQRVRTSSVADEVEYSFLHLVVRDVAYGQIPRADRAAKHRRTAEWIESLGRPEDHAETLAHHYSMALELARASGESTEELAERGRVVLREAGDRAMALNAFDAAARSYASALELWPRDDPERSLLLMSYGKAQALGQESGVAELAEAAQALAELGDHEHAAEAEILLADLHWRAGRRDETDAYIERAVRRLQDVASSPAKARVLAEVSRSHMLADRRQAAIRIGREALAMATELGLHEVRAHVLNSIGTSRVALGDVAGLVDVEQSIEIASEIGSVEALRGYNNLFSSLAMTGALEQAVVVVDAGVKAAERFGNSGAQARWILFERLPASYWSGRWDESLRLIEETLDEVGPAHALARWAYELRGRIRLPRGDLAGALDDAKKSLDLGRKARDPQTLYPAITFAAFASLEAGLSQEAEDLAEELMGLAPSFVSLASPPVSSVFDLAWIFAAFERSGELLEVLERTEPRTLWIQGAEAIVRGDHRKGADIYAEMGTLPNEAYTRLRAAEHLVKDGWRTEADVQLEQALAFYRSVGATRYIRAGETLLPASA
jgi:class 3 adenylate cyclase/tetratricopeptide (TPR) repeat protein